MKANRTHPTVASVQRIALSAFLAIGFAAAIPGAIFGQQGVEFGKIEDEGTAAYKKGSFADAEKSFLDAQQLAKSFPAGDERIARTMNNLALVYDAEGKNKEAEDLYKQSIALKQAAEKPDYKAINATLNNLASLYKKLNRVPDALDVYKQTLANAEKADGAESA
ncbi:MAG: tetratricopeptide repeat protein, partial [Candidatus Obscuribacterales bacterium]|nr:tetratricopeptide repeat protein [Candidatus Obscuribacterales bacterium]